MYENLIKKRLMIIGSNGMLGQRTVEFYKNQNQVNLLSVSIEDKPVIEDVDYESADIQDREGIKKIIYNFCPDFIINTAAYTNVDKSETERELAWKINVKGVEFIAEAARVIDAQVIHISTDYVFDGKNGPYSESQKPNPINYYGRTKFASENALKISGVLYTILRTNVLYGITLESRPDFVQWVINKLNNNEKIRIVTDQVNNPTYIDDLVQGISKIVEFKKTGIYNIGGREFLSRFDFTKRIADYFELDESRINPIVTSDLNQAARRPLSSGLITIKAESELGYQPHSIEESFALIKKELAL